MKFNYYWWFNYIVIKYPLKINSSKFKDIHWWPVFCGFWCGVGVVSFKCLQIVPDFEEFGTLFWIDKWYLVVMVVVEEADVFKLYLYACRYCEIVKLVSVVLERWMCVIMVFAGDKLLLAWSFGGLKLWEYWPVNLVL